MGEGSLNVVVGEGSLNVVVGEGSWSVRVVSLSVVVTPLVLSLLLGVEHSVSSAASSPFGGKTVYQRGLFSSGVQDYVETALCRHPDHQREVSEAVDPQDQLLGCWLLVSLLMFWDACVPTDEVLLQYEKID